MLGNRNPWKFENEDMQENFSKVTKYTFRTTDRAIRFRSYMLGCPTDTLWIQEDNVVYAVQPSLQSWVEVPELCFYISSSDLIELGKLEAIMVYDGEGSYIGLKRWNKEGQLIKDYLKGEYNLHNFGEPIQP